MEQFCEVTPHSNNYIYSHLTVCLTEISLYSNVFPTPFFRERIVYFARYYKGFIVRSFPIENDLLLFS